MAKQGRQSSYTQAVADEICERIALGESLRKISADERMPSLRTIMNWRATNESFMQQYAHAKEDQAETYEEMMLETAKQEKDVARARLIVDTMKWTASKLKPKKYGDKVDMTSDGKQIQVIPLVDLSKLKEEE